jgi:P-aminobenzoate N-oxygenase AurF
MTLADLGEKTEAQKKLESVVVKLSRMSVRDHFDPHETFQWPETIEPNQMWMSRELLSVYNTELEEQLSEAEIQRLSRWESINFYSLNVHGIRELLAEVVYRIHMPGYEEVTPFLHHFIGEENDHMWFFSEFCLRYGKKIYPTHNLAFGDDSKGVLQDIKTFSRIFLFEEIVDHFNKSVADDESIDPFIRKLNYVHHRDESRHIAFGRSMVINLFEKFAKTASKDDRQNLDEYLRNYLKKSVFELYNPTVYQDAQLPFSGFEARQKLVNHEGRQKSHKAIIRKPESFLLANDLISKPVFH